MRIAFVITRGDDIGGAQVHVRDLAGAFMAQGHAAAVLAGGTGKFCSELASRGIPCFTIRRLACPIAPVEDLLALLEIIRTLREFKPDIVSAHTAKAGLLGRIAAAVLGLPAVFTPHGWAITDRISPRQGKVFRRVEALGSLVSSRIVNVCEFEAGLAMKCRVAPAAKLAVVHNGLPDIGEKLRADVAAQPPRLVMTARMAEPKDHPTLLTALSGLKHLEWTLDLIGDGPLEDGLRRRAEELGIANRVRFLGFCEDAAVRIAAAQVFVLASRFEAFPYSILEAMRAGLPVVASHVGGIPEAVVPGRTGLLAPVGDVEVLRRCLANLIVNPGLRQQLGDRGRERYLEHFTLDRMFARTLGIYQDVLSAASASDRREPLADSGRQLEPTAAFAGWSAGPKSTKVR
jgi:glycosyltransferase involved in cell wall biosynthesis